MCNYTHFDIGDRIMESIAEKYKERYFAVTDAEYTKLLKLLAILRKPRKKLSPNCRHPNAKLSIQDVLDIRERAAIGVKQKVLALDYNVTEGAISRIVHRKAARNIL
jgi:hypothetical protein